MDIKSFKRVFDSRNAVILSDDLILFKKNCELYNAKTDSSVRYGNLDEVIEDNPNVREIIEKAQNFNLSLDGGRGSGSLSGKMGGGFNHAPDGRGGGGEATPRFAAAFNALNAKMRSTEETLRQFANKYRDARIEYGVTVHMDNGFVTQHVEGGPTSVGIWGRDRELVIHNHPSGGNFSDSDLLNAAQTRAAGIVAVGSNTGNSKTYTLIKGSHFDSTGFIKGVKNAKWPVEYDYDKGADWWLRNNAKKYGYTYTARETKR